MVRGGQLHRFLAWLLHVNRLLMSPKLGGERHLEAEEIRRSSRGFWPRRSWKLHALCFSFAFGGAVVQSGELTVPNSFKITLDNIEKQRKVNFIHLTVMKRMLRMKCFDLRIYKTFLGITCVLPRSTVANYK